MSGGVDSSAAAKLLIDQGYKVTAVRIDLWSENESEKQKSIEDARRVSEALGIDFHEFDYTEKFRDIVIHYFQDEYTRGKTPNPCVLCNAEVKIPVLLHVADQLGIDYIATGHYARIEKDDATGRYNILPALNSSKDQTYALSRLRQDQLARMLTPLSHISDKNITREIAATVDARISVKKDSQEICFIKDDYVSFLERQNIKGVAGKFVLDGEIVGDHRGIEKYTIGQRKGLGSFGKKVFVQSISADTGDVVLGINADLYKSELYVEDLNFISIEGLSPGEQLCCRGKLRYAATKAGCKITAISHKALKVIFEEPQRAITPGQAAVFYDEEDRIICSGTISLECPKVEELAMTEQNKTTGETV